MVETLSFVTWLKKRRKQLGYTQLSLAERVNCSWETIRRIEDGTRKPSAQLAELLVEALDVPAEERQSLVHSARMQPAEQPSIHASHRPNNLPHQVTSFVGRGKEVAAISSTLWREDVSLVTLTGAGGSGKTRLALQVAAQLLDSFSDGAYFVNLAPIADTSLVAFTIARTLGVRERAGETTVESLQSYLSEKRMLLLLDNYEQVVESAPLVADLLAAAPRLKVLVTSREALRLRGEHNFPVPTLSLPDTSRLPSPEYLAGYEAVRLFLDRATAHKPDFQLTEDNAQAVAEICVRLDGLPLAIELAAARTRVLPPRYMLTLLQDRLKLLTGGPKNLPARQQTLRSAIEWSYALLDDADKVLFRRLAIFQGGRTLEAIEQVCSTGIGSSDPEIEVLDGVGSLVSKSLLRQHEGREGQLRFWLLETVYEYAREKLQESGEAEELSREHAVYFMKLVEEAEPHLTGNQQLEWLNRLEDEHDNIRAALRWATQRGNREGIEVGLRIGAVAWRFWYTRGYLSEGREYLSRVLEHAGTLTGVAGATVDNGDKAKERRARVLAGAGRLAQAQGDFAGGRTLHEESLAISRQLGDKRGVAGSLSNLGNIAQAQGDFAYSRALYEESLAMFRQIGDRRGIANSLNNVGLAAYIQGDHASAPALHEESLAIYRQLGDKQGIASSLSYLGYAAFMRGNLTSARALHEESLAISRQLGDRRGIGYELSNLGAVASVQGDYAYARSLNEEALAIRRELGDRGGLASSLSNLGNVLFLQGDYASARTLHEESLALKIKVGAQMGIGISLGALGEVEIGSAREAEKGVRLLGASEAILGTVGVGREPDDHLPYEQAIALARVLLSAERFDAAWQEGRAMSVEQAIEYALGR